MPATNPQPQPKPARPAHEVSIKLIKAAIWANRGSDGVFYNVTFERRYKDGEDWKSTNSFGRDDLLNLAKLADEAHTWITKQRGTPKPGLNQATLPKNR